jgi:hypothetical protein
MADNISNIKFRKIAFLIALGCVIVVSVSGFEIMMAKVKDLKRLIDIKKIERALDAYHGKYGFYPESIDDWMGWDLSYEYKGNKGFLEILKKERMLDYSILDPINDETYHYRYAKYNAGDYGCEKAYYILQVINFEMATEKNGKGICPGFDFAEDFTNGYTVQRFD